MHVIRKTLMCIVVLMSWFCLAVKPCFTSDYCESKFKSSSKSDSDQARILRGLASNRFISKSISDGFKTEYTLGVCGNASSADPLAGVLQNGTTVLGRVNNTSVVKGGDWMMMIFGSGDVYPGRYNCSGPRVAFVMIHCNHNASAEVQNSLRFIKEAREERYSCFFMFELHSQLVCAQPSKIEGSTILLIILLFGLIGYFVGGTLYRRYVLGAKGLEQIPNLEFWKAMNQKVMDGCNNMRCKKRPNIDANTWESIDSRVERDDDSLLSP